MKDTKRSNSVLGQSALLIGEDDRKTIKGQMKHLDGRNPQHKLLTFRIFLFWDDAAHSHIFNTRHVLNSFGEKLH